MYKHVLIPTDGSELSALAIEHGIALAKSLNAKVTGITVFRPYQPCGVETMFVLDSPEQYRREAVAWAEKYLRAIMDAAHAANVPCDVVVAERDQIYRAIIDAARAKGCDVIVMASHGRKGVDGVLLGSETSKVLTHSKIPVVVCR
jgi:nucleotide-binding universal stress UspA family protein